jgi:hypothetical protein
MEVNNIDNMSSVVLSTLFGMYLWQNTSPQLIIGVVVGSIGVLALQASIFSSVIITVIKKVKKVHNSPKRNLTFLETVAIITKLVDIKNILEPKKEEENEPKKEEENEPKKEEENEPKKEEENEPKKEEDQEPNFPLLVLSEESLKLLEVNKCCSNSSCAKYHS